MIVTASELAKPLQTFYENGLPSGDKTGWPSMDPFYTVRPGQMTIVTGIPSHGKSEWLDALMVNLIPDWRFLVFSPENFPHELHLAKLLEKYLRAPFAKGPHPRITPDKLAAGVSTLDYHLGFFKPHELQVPNLHAILNEAGIWFETFFGEQKRGLIIDPFNELEHQRPAGITETEYISQFLSEIRQWARNFEVHVWVVAHPMKLQKDKSTGDYPVPTPYDISGSAHWRNKADNCITVWRDVKKDNGIVEIHIQKIRFKNIGKPGMIELRYDRITGRYSEMPKAIDISSYRQASGGDD